MLPGEGMRPTRRRNMIKPQARSTIFLLKQLIHKHNSSVILCSLSRKLRTLLDDDNIL